MALNSFQTSGNSPGSSRCRVGILGYGTVGSAIARRLTSSGDNNPLSHLQLTHICDRRAREKRAREPEGPSDRSDGGLSDVVWTDRFDDLLAADVDVVVEVIGGVEPAVDYVRAALLAGKSVVTANRYVIANHGPSLLTLAERQGRQLRYEAAVGGAMPIVRALGDGLAGERVSRIDAILNGTSNAVLSQMERTGCGIDEAIAEACARGYAEVNPSTDLDGVDAAAKLSILCALAFSVRVVPSQIETLTTIHVQPDDVQQAKERGRTVRQMAHAEYDPDTGRLTVWVAPRIVPVTSIFGQATGPMNAAVITGRHAGQVTMTGQGAGGDATAVAALGDLAVIARDRAAIVPAPTLVEPRDIRGLSDHKLAEAV